MFLEDIALACITLNGIIFLVASVIIMNTADTLREFMHNTRDLDDEEFELAYDAF